MDEMLIFLRNFLIVAAVISIPLAIIWWGKQQEKKKALDRIQYLPAENRKMLRALTVPMKLTPREKLKYASKSLLFGAGLYLIFVIVGFLVQYKSDGAINIKDNLAANFLVMLGILLFIAKDLLRVAPWVTVYRLMAIGTPSYSSQNIIFCYYDDRIGDFSAEVIGVSRWTLNQCSTNGEVYQVLAVDKGTKWKVFGIWKH